MQTIFHTTTRVLLNESIPAMEKLPESFDCHDAVHGKGVYGEIENALLTSPIGTIRYAGKFSHRWIAQRVSGGILIGFGQENGNELRIDVQVMSDGHRRYASTELNRCNCHSTIMRENRDCLPVGTNENVQLWFETVFAGLALPCVISDYVGKLSYKDQANDLHAYFHKHNQNRLPQSYRIPEDYQEFAENRINSIYLERSERAMATLNKVYGNGNFDTISYSDGKFVTGRGVSFEMDYETAKSHLTDLKPFPTPFGVFSFHGETARCGCHRFSVKNLREFFGLEERKEEETEVTWNDALDAYRAEPSEDNKAQVFGFLRGKFGTEIANELLEDLPNYSAIEKKIVDRKRKLALRMAMRSDSPLRETHARELASSQERKRAYQAEEERLLVHRLNTNYLDTLRFDRKGVRI